MTSVRIILLGLLLLVTTGPARAVQEITWEHLRPATSPALTSEADQLQATIEGLSGETEQLWSAIEIELTLRRRIASGEIQPDNLSKSSRRLLEEAPSREHPDATAFWNKVEVVKARLLEESMRVKQSLDGESVRLPGYVLPLEVSAGQVREFLLVPFVGACIHVPPPPSNQMVFVRPDKPFASEGLYEAVTVQGRLSTRGGTWDLTLVDGQAPVSASYSMDQAVVRPYK